MAEKPDNRLTIDFTGLCVLVTNDPSGDLKVILACNPMPQGMAMGKTNGHAHKDKMVHKPLLSFNVKNLSRFKGDTPIQVVQLPNGDQIASWDLSDRIVRMKEWGNNAHPKGIQLVKGNGPLDTVPPDPASEMDLRWIPSLAKVSGSGAVIDAYLTNDPRPPNGRNMALAARFDFPAGYLYANAQVNRQSDMRPWAFKQDKKTVLKQYLADSARLELQSSETVKVTFEAFRFGKEPQEASERLELMPKEGRIEISVSNLPVTLPKAKQKGMPHFDIYYSLLKNPRQEPKPELASGAGRRPAAKSPSPGAVLNAHPHGVYPIKCTPTLLP